MDRYQLIELFEYDLWANSRWIEFLRRKAWPKAEQDVFSHLLASQRVWLMRCQGASPHGPAEVELSEMSLRHLNHEWIEVLKNGEPDSVIYFKRFTGEPSSMSMRHIALQVISHGSYHRGDLRGLCRAKGEEGHPETDLMLFYLERGASA